VAGNQRHRRQYSTERKVAIRRGHLAGMRRGPAVRRCRHASQPSGERHPTLSVVIQSKLEIASERPGWVLRLDTL